MEGHDPQPEILPVGQLRSGTFAPTKLSSARPPIGRWLALAVIGLTVAVAKPWASAPAPPATVARTSTGEHSMRQGPTSAPTVRPDSAGPQVAAFCLDPGSWRIATIEHWRDQSIRVWRAIEPASTASGPADARIPTFPIVSEGITELGWCAPVVGSERPVGQATVDAWQRTPVGLVAIRTNSVRVLGAGPSFGNLYLPPGAPESALWPDGDYVFRYREAAGRERWFAVEVERRPKTSGPLSVGS